MKRHRAHYDVIAMPVTVRRENRQGLCSSLYLHTCISLDIPWIPRLASRHSKNTGNKMTQVTITIT